MVLCGSHEKRARRVWCNRVGFYARIRRLAGWRLSRKEQSPGLHLRRACPSEKDVMASDSQCTRSFSSLPRHAPRRSLLPCQSAICNVRRCVARSMVYSKSYYTVCIRYSLGDGRLYIPPRHALCTANQVTCGGLLPAPATKRPASRSHRSMRPARSGWESRASRVTLYSRVQ